MTKEQRDKLEEILEKLGKLLVEVELLVYPVRNIYDEQEKNA